MKKIFHLFIFLSFTLLATGCLQENSPEIPCLSCEDNTTGPLSEFTKKVLIEEFTGVRCVNCPQGSAEIENLISIHGDQLIAVSIHAGFFSNPYPESQIDFRTIDGDNLENFLGPVSLFPAAVIDRNLFNGEQSIVTGQASWSGYVAEQLNQTSPISVEIFQQYNTATRNLILDISGTTQSDLSNELFLSVLITENNLTDYQLTPEGIDSQYIHQHVLRDILTPFGGTTIGTEFTTGDTYNSTFTYTVPTNWNENNCTIIAYLHQNNSNKTILQAEQVNLIE